jgi:hypothetical protein
MFLFACVYFNRKIMKNKEFVILSNLKKRFLTLNLTF